MADTTEDGNAWEKTEGGPKTEGLPTTETSTEALQRWYREELQRRYRNSFVGTYKDHNISFEITNFRVLSRNEDQERALIAFQEGLPSECTPAERNVRYVYHCCPVDVVESIVRDGLRPSHCEICQGLLIHNVIVSL